MGPGQGSMTLPLPLIGSFGPFCPPCRGKGPGTEAQVGEEEGGQGCRGKGTWQAPPEGVL